MHNAHCEVHCNNTNLSLIKFLEILVEMDKILKHIPANEVIFSYSL